MRLGQLIWLLAVLAGALVSCTKMETRSSSSALDNDGDRQFLAALNGLSDDQAASSASSKIDCADNTLTHEWTANECTEAKNHVYENVLEWARDMKALCNSYGGRYTYVGKTNPNGSSCVTSGPGQKFVQKVTVGCSRATSCEEWDLGRAVSKSGDTVGVDDAPLSGYSIPTLGKTVLYLPLQTGLSESTGKKVYSRLVTTGSGGGYFNSKSYMRVSTSPEFDLGNDNFTIEMYARFTRFQDVNTLLSRWENPAKGYKLSYEAISQTSNGLIFKWSANGSTERAMGCEVKLDSGQWYHFAVSRSGAGMRMFVNGTLCALGRIPDRIASVKQPLDFARLNGDETTGLFNGQLAFVRIVRGQAMYRSHFVIGSLQPVSVMGYLFCETYRESCEPPSALLLRMMNVISSGVARPYDSLLDMNSDGRVDYKDLLLVEMFPFISVPEDGMSAADLTLKLLRFGKKQIGTAMGSGNPNFISPLDFNRTGTITLRDVFQMRQYLNAVIAGTHGQFNPDLTVGGDGGTAGTWSDMSLGNSPTYRSNYAEAWTGSDWVVWGGKTNGTVLGTGAQYDPVFDTWMTIPSQGAPSAREAHTAVWTGSQVLIWGGYNGVFYNNGAKYDPDNQTWSPMSSSGAPAARDNHVAVWTGTEMIVWGGYNGSTAVATGGIYNPTTNTWRTMNSTGAPSARYYHQAGWTGSKFVVWGGFNGTTYLNNGAIYDPANDTWTAITQVGAPVGRRSHGLAVIGNSFIVWGGWGTNNLILNDGALYDFESGAWSALPSDGPTERWNHTMAWTGTRLIVVGGNNGRNQLADVYAYQNGSWRMLNRLPAVVADNAHIGVWTEIGFLLWGSSQAGVRDSGFFSP